MRQVLLSVILSTILLLNVGIANAEISCVDWFVASISGPNPTAMREAAACTDNPQMASAIIRSLNSESYPATMPQVEVEKTRFVGKAPADKFGGEYYFYTTTRGEQIVWYVITTNALGHVINVE